MRNQLTVVLLSLLALLALAACNNQAANTPAAPAAQATDVLPPVRASNDVVADAVVVPARTANLSLPGGGIVAEILVEEGAQVEAGQPLLRVQALRQQAAVAQAEAGVERAVARLAELRAGPRSQEVETAQAAVDAAAAQVQRIEEGAKAEDVEALNAALDAARANLERVREGAPQQQVIAAEADLGNAEAALRQAQAAYDRVAGQADVGQRPESLQLQQATNAYNAARARLDEIQSGATAAEIAAAQAQVRQAQAQLASLQAPARASDLAAAQAELRRAQAQLDLLQAGVRPETLAAARADLASAEAALQDAQAVLGDAELVAPFAGVVAELLPTVGEQVGPGAPVVTLADFSRWQVETDDLTELNIVRVREGAAVRLTFDALPGLTLPGKVVQIKPIGVNKQGDITYTVVIAPDQWDERLRWNMTAVAMIQADR
jgi:multidrug resistance efflux pump